MFDHLRYHSGEKPYICPVQTCLKKFTQKSNMKKHLFTKHKLGSLCCAVCQEQFKKHSVLFAHAEAHITEENEVFIEKAQALEKCYEEKND